MPSLEELLLDSGAMTEAQLAIVRDEMRIKGGSVDTNILALGYLTEQALQRIIALQWDQVGEVDFEQMPTDEALALLSPEEAEELRAVPQTALSDRLYVLVLDPDTVDNLKAMGRLADYEIHPVGVNEVRLLYYLDRCYGVRREPRYVEIMDRLMMQAVASRERLDTALDPLIGDPMAGLEPEWMAGAEILPPTPSGAAAGGEDDLEAEVIPILEDELLIEITEDEFLEEEALDDDQALDEKLQALPAEEFVTTLDAVESMDALPDIFFRFGVPHFKSMALFKVQSGMLMGWKGAGLGIQAALIRGIVVPTQSDTFLAKCIKQGPYVGQAGANAVEERITEQLGCATDAHIVTGAVTVGERPVMVICGITEDRPPEAEVVTDIGRLCELASQAVLRLIMARKKAKAAQATTAEDADGEAQEASEPAGKDAREEPDAADESAEEADREETLDTQQPAEADEDVNEDDSQDAEENEDDDQEDVGDKAEAVDQEDVEDQAEASASADAKPKRKDAKSKPKKKSPKKKSTGKKSTKKKRSRKKG